MRSGWMLGLVITAGLSLAGPLHGQPAGDAPNGDYGGFFTWPELRQRIDAHKAEHPGLLHETSLGKTLEGREIPLLRLSDDRLPPDATKSGEPELLLVAGIHPREQVPQTAILRLMEELLSGYGKDARLTRLLKERQLWIIPVFNLDGKIHDMRQGNGTTRGADWRKNRRKNADGSYGVDLNRNWPVRWGGNRQHNTAWNTTTANPKGNIYEGLSPLSEPENQLLARFIDARPLRGFVDIHSPFKQFLVPVYLIKPEAERYQTVLSAMNALQKEPYEGTRLQVDRQPPAGERSGDTGVTYTWSYYTRGIFSINVETGSGPGKGRERYPLPELVEEEYRLNLRGPLLYLLEACAMWPRPGQGTVRCEGTATEGQATPGATVTLRPRLEGEWDYAVLTSEDPDVVVQKEYALSPRRAGGIAPAFTVKVMPEAVPGKDYQLQLFIWDAQRRRSTARLPLKIAPAAP